MARVAVVDDEEQNRKLLARALGRFFPEDGIKIYETGDAFLDAYPTDGPFDAIFLDHTMPGRNGTEVLEAMKESDYPTDAVCMNSGLLHTEFGAVEALKDRFGIGYIKKPAQLSEYVAFCESRGMEKKV